MKARQTGRTQIACLAFAAIALSLGPVHPISAEPNDRVPATGSPAETSPRLTRPSDAVSGESGTLYIADTANHRIQRVTADGTVSTLAGAGIPGSSGDGGLATEAALNAPAGIALATDGTVFIADTGNNVIRQVDATTGFITTVAGRQQAGRHGDGGAATNAYLFGPMGIDSDGDDNLFIADTYNDLVRRVDAGTGRISTVALRSGELARPSAVDVTDTGRLVVTDTGNDRVVSTTVDGDAPDPAGPTIPAGVDFDPSITGEHAATTGNSGLVARLYMAVFSRQPDGPGFDYWVDAMQLGAGEATVSSSFVASEEFAATYDGLDDEAFLDRLYLNVMGRIGDTSGRTYWLGELDQGVDRAGVLLYFADSAEFRLLTGTN